MPIITPDVIVVPLLAFDSEGYRLGYGKGHYDRTLHQLKQNHNFLTVRCQRDSVLPVPSFATLRYAEAT